MLPADHRLAGQAVIRPKDLEGERFVAFGRQSAFRHLIDEVFRVEGVARRIVIEVGYAAAACALVANSVGIAIVDPLSALNAWRAGGITLAQFDADVLFVVDTVFPSGIASSVLAEQFLDTVKATLQEMGEAVIDACCAG
ncbi:LysR substrate-binding domain-containing protein [Burkholderia multivorans]|uniref:LysR substrate-binding domain-containing protein n=1 Tax=Burkholderia multivorans TaxID=87883 RepID=UPI0021C25497|nr:LysR substrate-binding domain-containing protein [Burkholderia multivorans]